MNKILNTNFFLILIIIWRISYANNHSNNHRKNASKCESNIHKLFLARLQSSLVYLVIIIIQQFNASLWRPTELLLGDGREKGRKK